MKTSFCINADDDTDVYNLRHNTYDLVNWGPFADHRSVDFFVDRNVNKCWTATPGHTVGTLTET